MDRGFSRSMRRLSLTFPQELFLNLLLLVSGAALWLAVAYAEMKLQGDVLRGAAPAFFLMSGGIRILLYLVFDWPAAMTVAAGVGIVALTGHPTFEPIPFLAAAIAWGLLPYLAFTAVRLSCGLGSRLAGLKRRHLIAIALADSAAVGVAALAMSKLMDHPGIAVPIVTATSNLISALALLSVVYISLKLARLTKS
jgi:hypothetical protein